MNILRKLFPQLGSESLCWPISLIHLDDTALIDAGVTWVLSSQVMQMAESNWLEQLQAFSQHLASVGQRVATEYGRITDWFLHQQGLFALGDKTCLCSE